MSIIGSLYVSSFLQILHSCVNKFVGKDFKETWLTKMDVTLYTLVF